MELCVRMCVERERDRGLEACLFLCFKNIFENNYIFFYFFILNSFKIILIY
jgi:hypothetical protein